ncbi:MAG: hypothetical protein EXR98_07125 [Gemmataceae bacterium]|nr:hypothetical protein [Gemmataceae bacterium]
MSRSSFSFFLLLAAGIFLAGAVVSNTPVAAQEINPPPRIVTVDGVSLNAAFYPSPNPKKNSPAVILLHPIGENKSSKGADWKRLAETLQKANYSVITFDFRGHGDSTTFDPKLFYKKEHGLNNLVKVKAKETIMLDDYIKNNQYLPALINDIAAVKAYLELRNDAGECNTANTIVIGADTGATLGAIWINSECYRYKFTPNPITPAVILKGGFSANSEAENIVAAVFLTIQTKLGTRPVNITKTLKVPSKDQGMAVTFVYGKEDTKGKPIAQNLESNLFVKNSKKHVFIGTYELNTALTGAKLLQPALKLDEAIVEYLDKVILNRGNEWGKRDSKENFHMWKLGNFGPFYPAHKKGLPNLHFDAYEKFIAQ